MQTYKGILLIISFLVTAPVLKSQELLPGENLRITLLTYSPGNELYSLFGHSAVRITDPLKETDNVYNYGTFDFDQPYFYIKFIRGSLLYSLSRVPYEHVRQSIILENRSLVETPLNLTQAEKLSIRAYLENNLKPANRDYLYDFQYDNCSSRIIDLLNSTVNDTLVLKAEVLPVGSFRTLIDPYLRHRPWVHLGIDILMGMRADRKAQMLEPAFLPDYLHLFVKNFKVVKESARYNLAQEDISLVQNPTESTKRNPSPALFFLLLAILFLISALIDSYLRGFFLYLGNILLVFTGILSVLLLLLWFLTSQAIFANNTDILWANPLLLLLAFYRKRISIGWLILKYLCLILVLIGLATSLFIEKNTDIAALAALIGVHLIAGILQQGRARKTAVQLF
jgi:hypothetical protein